jgi:predicted lipoprotein with Yx(FWY)xxD motif
VSPTTTPSPSAAALTINVATKPNIGQYLVDGKGMTLYYFTKDTIGKSTAVGGVLQAWPLFNAANFTVPSSLSAADFATVTRADGAKVTTYKGWPLYYFAKDAAPGDILGEGVGGVWFVIKVPFYTVMLATKADVGNYMVDAKGMALYYFTKDSVGKSTATGAVLASWPVFNASTFVIPSTWKASDFGTITRDDGLKVTTYKGWPLYYFAKDAAPGDTQGQGVGNVWYVIDPANFPPTSSGPAGTIALTAQNMSFTPNNISVAAGSSVTINFTNKDATVPHNFSVYSDANYSIPFFRGNAVTGPGTTTYTFTAPTAAGTYYFRCDIHPNMRGTLTVTAPAASPSTPSSSGY